MKRVKKGLSLVMVCMMLVCSAGIEAFAAENTEGNSGEVVVLEAEVTPLEWDSDISTYATVFRDATIDVSRDTNGMLIEISTIMNGTASIVGVKDVVIKHKVWWGWETAATSTGGSVSNNSGMSCSLLYRGAVQGDSYRITCVHYGDVDGYRELPNDSGDFKYNF